MKWGNEIEAVQLTFVDWLRVSGAKVTTIELHSIRNVRIFVRLPNGWTRTECQLRCYEKQKETYTELVSISINISSVSITMAMHMGRSIAFLCVWISFQVVYFFYRLCWLANDQKQMWCKVSVRFPCGINQSLHKLNVTNTVYRIADHRSKIKSTLFLSTHRSLFHFHFHLCWEFDRSINSCNRRHLHRNHNNYYVIEHAPHHRLTWTRISVA